MKKNKAFILATLGAAVQYYDYNLYGFLAATISKVFFPDEDVTLQLLKAYLVMFLGVTAKPIGALILGKIGDIYGRSRTLTISLIGTAIPSLIIAITPGYERLGIIAALILLLCRMCICAFVSSGTDGVRLFIYEQIGKKRQCFGNGLVTMATMVGAFGASLAAWFFTLDFMPDYAWRYAFIIGTVMGAAMVLLRDILGVGSTSENLQQSTEYDIYKSSSTLAIINQHKWLFLLCIILAGTIGGSYQFNIIFFGTYNFKILGLIKESKMQFFTSIAVVIYMIFAVIAGLTADYFGRRKVATIAGSLVIVTSAINAYTLANDYMRIEIYFLNTLIMPFLIMPALAILKQSIPMVVRYRIFSLAHAIGSILLSGTTAVVSTYLYRVSEYKPIPVIYFMLMMGAMITVINILCDKYNADKI